MIAGGIPLDAAEYVIVDVETTGLAAQSGDRVCEIGAVRIRGGSIIDSFGTLIDPQRPLSQGAYAVNRISPEMLIGAPIFPDVADRIWQMMDGAVVVAYNAPFDLSFLTNEFRLAGYPPILHVVVDALAIARQLLPGLGKYGQEQVARVVGIPFPVKHRALEDAMVTGQLFLMFMSIMKAHGFTTIADLRRCDLSENFHSRRMSIVNDALTRKAELWIKYLSPSNAEITDRVVTPKAFTVESHGRKQSTYLVAYCHSAKAERNFRIDRILDIRIVDSLFI